MADKLRSSNMSSSLGAAGGGLSTLIGNPTLISSTLSTNHQLTPTVDLMTASVRESSSPTALNSSNNNSDMESSSEFAPGTITAQLNFQLLPTTLDGSSGAGGGGGATAIFDYNSIMNSSQISAMSHDSLQQQQQSSQQISNAAAGNTTTSANNSMALVKAGAGKPVVAQSVAGVS